MSKAKTSAAPVLGPIQRIQGGWRVHSTARFHVDILKMLGANLRLVTTPVDQPRTYTRAWCYQRPLVEVVLAAVALDPDGDGEPVGWIKGGDGAPRLRLASQVQVAGACWLRSALPGLRQRSTRVTRTPGERATGVLG